MGGVLFVTTTVTGNITTGEDTLATYTVPASTLAVNNDSLWFEATGTISNSATATRTLRVKWGSETVATFALSTIGSLTGFWKITGRIIRTGAATQIGQATRAMRLGTVPTTDHDFNTGLTRTLSSSQALAITGEATLTDDLTLDSFIIGWDSANS